MAWAQSATTGITEDSPMNSVYANPEPPRAEIDVFPGPTMVEFGSPTCGICFAAQPVIAEATAGLDQLRHIKIEDGRGRRLGRSFGIKLWPTLVFLRDGQEVIRLVRPTSPAVIKNALQLIL
jgi:thioredoxin 1